jgi:hypothetical protein
MLPGTPVKRGKTSGLEVAREGSALANAQVSSATDRLAAENQFGKGVEINRSVSQLLRPMGKDARGNKMRVNFLVKYDVQELLYPTKKNLNVIWAHYDFDGGGTLDAFEIRVLAIELVERTFVFLAEELMKKGKMSAKQLDAKTLEEAFFYLPGQCRTSSEMVVDMVNHNISTENATQEMTWPSCHSCVY